MFAFIVFILLLVYLIAGFFISLVIYRRIPSSRHATPWVVVILFWPIATLFFLIFHGSEIIDKFFRDLP